MKITSELSEEQKKQRIRLINFQIKILVIFLTLFIIIFFLVIFDSISVNIAFFPFIVTISITGIYLLYRLFQYRREIMNPSISENRFINQFHSIKNKYWLKYIVPFSTNDTDYHIFIFTEGIFHMNIKIYIHNQVIDYFFSNKKHNMQIIHGVSEDERPMILKDLQSNDLFTEYQFYLKIRRDHEKRYCYISDLEIQFLDGKISWNNYINQSSSIKSRFLL